MPKSKKRKRAAYGSLRAPALERLWHTPDEFIAHSGLSRAKIWKMMAGGQLRYAQLGDTRRIPVSEYERLVAAEKKPRTKRIERSERATSEASV